MTAALPPDSSEPVRPDSLRPLGKRRSLPRAPLTLAERTEMDETLSELAAAGVDVDRARTFGECPPGPCGFLSCRHHLGIEVSRAGTVKILSNLDDIESWPQTCSLRAAAEGPLGVPEIAAMLNISAAAVQHIEADGIARMRGGFRVPRRRPAPAPQSVPEVPAAPPPPPAPPERASKLGAADRPKRSRRKRLSSPQPMRPADPARGARLREFLTRHRIRQSELAREIGVSQQLINLVATGRNAISADLARSLALVFGTTSWFWLNPSAGAEPLAFQDGKPAGGAL
jgi:addiction module HigA family antidote